mgnify:FL=1
MAQVSADEYYNVQKNILDRVDSSDSFDEEQAKGLALLFGLDVFQKLIQRNEQRVVDEKDFIKNEEILRNGRNDVLWNKRNEVLENNKKIETEGVYNFFDAQAENVFMNPLSHENSNIKKERNDPDWTFDPREFEDPKSPMYKVKEAWKRDYINEVLYKQHEKKYKDIDKKILTFDEFNKNNTELTRNAIAYSNRPENQSILRRWNLFGKKRTAKLKANYDKATNDYKILLKAREGILNSEDDTFPLTPLNNELYSTGEVYNKFDFQNLTQFQGLLPTEQVKALELFEKNEFTNDSYQVSKILTLVQMNSDTNRKETFYTNIKNNDPDFEKIKPKRKPNQSPDDYKKSQVYLDWFQKREDAYAEGTEKYINAREKAGFNLSFTEQYADLVYENLESVAGLQIAQKQLQNNEINQEEYDVEVQNYISKTASLALEAELGTVDKVQEYITAVTEVLNTQLFNETTSREGQDYVFNTFLPNENKKRKEYNENLIATGNPEDKKPIPLLTRESAMREYRLRKQDEIIDYAAFLTNTLILDPATGTIGRNPELRNDDEYFNISPDFFE